ncbi:putative two-component response regulator with GGDEF domain [Desulfovibrio sp. DV]|uniref:diguanylate cyclase n=1 Tax=Desulfovibrio sp. DV TaxID=1844708 RepID=UPI00094B7D74|nr:diguanylate cyclase [Desulfovibrio sp. DV]OLN25044.1 putative two-component response regulator with GGDEF domain [Desulfovibrio sp. DV]
MGGTEKRAPLLVVAVAAAAAAFFFTFIHNDIISRRIYGSLIYALLCLASGQALLKYKTPDIAVASRSLAAIFMANGLALATLAATPVVEALGLPFFPRPIPMALTFLILILLSWLTTIGLIILVNQRLAAESQVAQENMRASKLFLQSVLNGLTAHIALIDASGDIILVNEAWRDFARDNGLAPELAGEGTNYLCACDNATEAGSFAAGIRQVLAGELEQFTMEYPCHAPHQPRWFVGRVTPFPGDGPRRVVVAHEDISERKLMELALAETNQKLGALSATDGLTGIANRRHFDEVFASEYPRHTRSGMTLSLVMLDIDYFKNYNDAYGHAKGDDCLAQVAGTIARSLQRKTDLAARYGGEEFICLLPETELAGAATVAEDIRQSVARLAIPHAQSAAAPVVTVSVGVLAAKCSPGAVPGDLYKQVDALLYQAKANGRNRVESAGPAPDAEAAAASQGIIRIFWDNTFASGNETIDRQHKLLIAQANELLLLTTQNPSCAVLSTAIDTAFRHVAEHFRDEERILQEIGFPGLAEHAAEHHRLLQKGLALATGCTEPAPFSGDIIRYIVHDLVMEHMLSGDIQYHFCFKAKA